MKPIIPIAIAVIGIFTLISSGSLLADTVDVWIQGVGLGSAVATDPVEHVSVDWKITPTIMGTGQDAIYKNKFTSCSFHIAEADILNQDMDPTDVDGVEKVICKITDNNHKVIGEGSKTFLNGGKISCSSPGVATDLDHFCPSQQYFITQLDEAYTNALLMQNVFDVTIVVIGENPTNVTP